jgi:hypothetical protein
MSTRPVLKLRCTRVRACRVCGCTNTNACVNPKTGIACHWVAQDLCSMCPPKKKGRS